MPRRLPLLVVLLLPSLAFAQPTPTPFLLTPNDEPKPALRYELLPTGREKVAGNAAVHYLKALVNRPPRGERAKAVEEEKSVQGWEEAAIDKLPVEDVKTYLARYAAVLREVERGAACKTCEWESTPTTGAELLFDLEADVQGHREVLRYLSLRARVELAEKKFDAAVRSIRTGLQYGRHVGEGRSLIQLLVGYSICQVMLQRVEEFIQQADAPNLYWALATLPRPLVDVRPALDGEDLLNESSLPGLAELRKGPVSAEKALDVAEHAVKVLSAATDEAAPFGGVALRLSLSGAAALQQAEAKKELAARGWAAKSVDDMPAVQVVFLASFEAYRELADDHRKWFFQPFPAAFDGLTVANRKAKQLKKGKADDAMFQTLLLFLPAVEKVHQSGARMERRLAMLQTVEALRMHSDATGRWPAALADVKKVPVPVDPLTGMPFDYKAEADGQSARLSGLAPGTPAIRGLETKLDLKLRK